jgi:transcriptional regulator with XRE-family HTH domain
LVRARLRQARKLQGLTLKQLGKRVGLSENYLSEIENGLASPRLAVAFRLSAELGLPVEWLFPDVAERARSAQRAAQEEASPDA